MKINDTLLKLGQLQDAIELKKNKLANQILKENPELIHKLDSKGNTLLSWIVQLEKTPKQRIAMIDFALKKGANINQQGGYGETVLHSALKFSFVELEIVKHLLKKGASLHIKNLKFHTPLQSLQEDIKMYSFQPCREEKLNLLNTYQIYEDKNNLEKNIIKQEEKHSSKMKI